MKFVCDKCDTQYLIGDEKIGANGVKVRCKRCGNIVFVKHPETEKEETSAQDNGQDLFDDIEDSKEEQDQVGMAFDQLLKESSGHNGDDDQEEQEEEEEAGFSDNGATVLFNVDDIKRAREQSGQDDEDSEKIDSLFSDADETSVPAARAFSDDDSDQQWYLAISDQQVGPMDVAEVENRLHNGEIGRETLAWQPGMDDWAAIEQLDEFSHLFGSTEDDKLGDREFSADRDSEGSDWQHSTSSELSELIEEEMRVSKGEQKSLEEELPDDSADELPSDADLPPWEQGEPEEEAPVEDDVGSAGGFFDSSLDQAIPDNSGPFGSGVHSRSSILGQPAYLSGETGRRPKNKLLIIGIMCGIFIVGLGISAYILFSGDDTQEKSGEIEEVEQESKVLLAEAKNKNDTPKEQKAETKEEDQPKESKDQMVVGKTVEKKQPSTAKSDKKSRSSSKTKGRKKRPSKTTSKPKKTVAKAPKQEKSSSGLPVTLTKAQIGSTMKKYLKGMKGCVQQQQQRDPSVTGTMLVAFEIHGSGDVKGVRITSSEHKGTYVAGCITYIIKSMKFPKFSGKPIPIPRIPLRLGG
jgi:predicted Zn finger-like uncharacterized protein